jgi:uncharacterized repeat protein (TIGR01451 family)
MMIVVLMLGCPVASFSATNTVIDPGGGSTSLIPSGPVTVNSVQLALVKQARDLAGAVLTTGANVTPGQTIYFVLYVDNTTAYPASDIQITDQLDESAFTYLKAAWKPPLSRDQLFAAIGQGVVSYQIFGRRMILPR